jgi:hypothetical protein
VAFQSALKLAAASGSSQISAFIPGTNVWRWRAAPTDLDRHPDGFQMRDRAIDSPRHSKHRLPLPDWSGNRATAFCRNPAESAKYLLSPRFSASDPKRTSAVANARLAFARLCRFWEPISVFTLGAAQKA